MKKQLQRIEKKLDKTEKLLKKLNKKLNILLDVCFSDEDEPCSCLCGCDDEYGEEPAEDGEPDEEDLDGGDLSCGEDSFDADAVPCCEAGDDDKD